MSTKADVLFEQRLLKCGGFYMGALDGLWGAQTLQAESDATALYQKLRTAKGALDDRSEKCIATLMPIGQRLARSVMDVGMQWTRAHGMGIRVLSGTRTYAEQDALFAQRPQVTRARGGQSNHNFGLAIDVGLFAGDGRYMTGAAKGDEAAYVMLAAAVKQSLGAGNVEWGGDWRSITDNPHYDVPTGLSMSQLRQRFESGTFNGK